MWADLKEQVALFSILAAGSQRLLGYVMLRSSRECNPISINDVVAADFTLRATSFATPPPSPPKGSFVMMDDSTLRYDDMRM